MRSKKNLVIICNSCYPVPSATGLLAMNCIRYLADDYDVRVISVQNSKKSFYKYRADGYELYTVGNLRLSTFYDVASKIHDARGFQKKLYQCVRFLTRVSGWVVRTFIHFDNYKWFERKAYKLLKKLNKEKKIDCIISVSEPIRAHIAAMKFKSQNPDVRWVCYWGDLYATDYFRSNIFWSVDRMNDLEKRIVYRADYILSNSEIYEHYREISTKAPISAVLYTLKERLLAENVPEAPESKKFIYFGSLSYTMRNPEYMLRLFLNSDYVLELYTAGCEDMIENYVEKSNGRIKAFGFVDQDQLKKRIREANVIINLGNSDPDFIPSKTLELLSYKKRILDLYYGDNEETPISKYPLLVRVANNTDIEEAKRKIDGFLQEKLPQIASDDLRNLFCDYTEERAQNIVRGAVIQ